MREFLNLINISIFLGILSSLIIGLFLGAEKQFFIELFQLGIVSAFGILESVYNCKKKNIKNN